MTGVHRSTAAEESSIELSIPALLTRHGDEVADREAVGLHGLDTTQENEMTEYVVLIVGDADRWWTSMSAEEREHGYAEYERFSAELETRGHKITGGAELHGNAETRRIPAGGGAATEGPFAENVEQVGGFYQVETDDLDDLLDCCQIVAALGDAIEVRRVVSAEERG